MTNQSPAEALRQLTDFIDRGVLSKSGRLKYREMIAAYAATVEREAHEKGKLEAYKNVVAWEDQYGRNPALSALAAHKAAVSDTEARLAALQGPRDDNAE